MNVAHLELCKELYGLSKWDDTCFVYCRFEGKIIVEHRNLFVNAPELAAATGVVKIVSAYDLGYLRKAILDGLSKGTFRVGEDETLIARLATALVNGENAACQLAIELIEREIFKPLHEAGDANS